MLHTGFRLIAILELLYEKNLSKTEIQNAIFEKYKIQISKETLKLDLNTLKEAGFEIKKGNRGNSFKFSLNKEVEPRFISKIIDKYIIFSFLDISGKLSKLNL